MANLQECYLPNTGLLRKRTILQFIDVKESTFKKWVRDGKVIPPIHVGRAAFWTAEYVHQLIEDIKKGVFK
ncbi:MAG: transcriptional regulator [Candidatus Riflebacteria bacterium]|nr:transcriptional regulator [Candidatus Riflebacteria bacterium]